MRNQRSDPCYGTDFRQTPRALGGSAKESSNLWLRKLPDVQDLDGQLNQPVSSKEESQSAATVLEEEKRIERPANTMHTMRAHSRKVQIP